LDEDLSSSLRRSSKECSGDMRGLIPEIKSYVIMPWFIQKSLYEEKHKSKHRG